MPTIPKEKLDHMVARWQQIQDELSAAPEQEIFVKLSKEFSELDPMVATIKEMRDAISETDDLAELLADADGDQEMAEMAELEKGELDEKIEHLDRALQVNCCRAISPMTKAPY